MTSVRAYLINLPAIPIGETDAVQAEWDEITGLIESLAAAAGGGHRIGYSTVASASCMANNPTKADQVIFHAQSAGVYRPLADGVAQYRQDKALADTRQARHKLTDLLAKQKHMFAVVGHGAHARVFNQHDVRESRADRRGLA